MNVNWIDTRDIYHRIIDAPDRAAQHQIFADEMIAPWEPMMKMFAADADGNVDPIAGAKAWHWLVPDQLTDVPESLRKLEAANAWETGAAAMHKARECFAPHAANIPINTFEGWLMLADPTSADPIMRGYTGATDYMNPRFVVQYDAPDDENLPKLAGAIVHEMYHLVRFRTMPWNIMTATLAEYIIHEGLAESFAAALFGEDIVGHYVTDFDDSQLQTAKALVGDNLETTGFNNLRSYIFGDYWAQKMGLPLFGMPDYGGYAIGYHVAQAYLQRTGKSVVEAAFVPAAQIVAESGYFD